GNLRVIALNQAAARGVSLLRREREAGVLAQGINRLNQTLAEAPLADNECPVVILQGSCNNLGSACALWIDQDNQRKEVFRIQLLRRIWTIRTACSAARFDNQLSLLKEGFANFNRFLEETARVVTKIEHQLIHILDVEFSKRLAQFLTCRFGKTLELDVSHTGTNHVRVIDRKLRDFV